MEARGVSPRRPWLGTILRWLTVFSLLAGKAWGADVRWTEDFENGAANWSIEGGVWETGIPASGPMAAHGGSRCAATVLGGEYPNSAAARLVSPMFTVPPAAEFPRLRFRHWFQCESDDVGVVLTVSTRQLPIRRTPSSQ